MVKVRGENPSLRREEFSQVKVAAAAAAVTLDIDNTEGFLANDYIVVGEIGTETCEAVKISSVTDFDTLVVPALVFAHSVDEPVRKTGFNQVRFQYSDTETGTFSDIETKDVDWQNPDQFTSSDFAAGTTSHWFRYNFYNSQTAFHGASSPARQIPTYYCSVKDVSDWLNIDIEQESEEAVPHQVAKMIRGVTEEIDLVTKTSFRTNTVSAADPEYFDGKRAGESQVYFTRHRPVISVTSLQTSTNDQESGPTDATYAALTLNTDYVLDKATGRFRITKTSKQPAFGASRGQIAYTWGMSKTPEDVRRLAVLMTIRELAHTAAGRGLIQGRGKEANIMSVEQDIQRILAKFTTSARSV